MEIRIENDNRRSTMIIKKENWELESLQEKMLLKNNIKGVAKLQLTFLNGDAFYRIDLKNYKSMEEHFAGKKINYIELENFLKSLSELSSNLDNYFLKGEDLLLSPEYIYYDEESSQWVFICIPNADREYGVENLAEYLVEKTDEDDDKAMELSSDYFNIAAEGRISPAEILKRSRNTAKAKNDRSGRRKRPERKRRVREISEYKEEKNTNTKTDSPVEKKKSIITGIVICAVLSLIAVGLYIIVLMNPNILTFLGLSGDDYLIAGVIIAVVFASAIIGIIHYYKKYSEPKNKYREKIEIQNEELMDSDYLNNAIEKAKYSYDDDIYDYDMDDPDDEFEVEDLHYEEDDADDFEIKYEDNYDDMDDEETVLLNRTVERKEKMAGLKGKVNGELISFSIGDKPFVIGKMSGKVNGLINDSAVSRIHACIRKNGSRYFINDLNSKNGTCLNERRLQPDENAEITDGDIVKFANVTMKFSLKVFPMDT